MGIGKIEVYPEDGENSFCTHEGLFHFKVMPFGLCNVPGTFYVPDELHSHWPAME